MKKILRLFLFTLVGAGAGFAYYYFIGCYSGSCPLTSKWYVTTLYGLVVGFIIGFPWNISREKKDSRDS